MSGQHTNAAKGAPTGAPAARQDTDPACATCGAALHFVAWYGAPGVGQAWECANGHPWAKVGGAFYDPADGVHIGDPEDFR